MTRVARPAEFALKNGSNLRFFFGSIRYSEVMKILTTPALTAVLNTFGIERVGIPDLASAKQTATVQRFKVHLFTRSGIDLFTKIEFSRRGLDSPFRAESVTPALLARYRLAPLIVPHYPAAVSEALWDEIRLRVDGLLAEGMKARDRAKKESGT